MATSPFISDELRQECEDLLTVANCQAHEQAYWRWKQTREHEPGVEARCKHHLLFVQRLRRESEPNDYDDDGRYGWRTTGWRDGGMIC